jgi:pimeloyl-ACP methyl ester carboxylesterase
MKFLTFKFVAADLLAAFLLFSGAAHATDVGAKPTIILVHGAFAGSSSWDGVADKLHKDGYSVVSAANPLRSVKSDADYVSDLIKSIPGPIVLVGHSYAGFVITAAVQELKNVKALVYVAAFAPETGENASALGAKYPGGTLGPTLAPPVKLSNGEQDLYIQQSKFHAQFAADVPAAKAELMATSQRPATVKSLNENLVTAPAWKKLPSYFIYGKADKNIPAMLIEFMAKRAASKKTVGIAGASHVVMISHPSEVADLIETAATMK